MSNSFSSKEQSTETQHSNISPRKVRFSAETETIFFDHDDDDDLRLRWCTHEDDLKFRRQWIRDVGILVRVMRLSSSANANFATSAWKFIGLESFASPALARFVAEYKRQHIDAVLTEQNQRRQHALHVTNNTDEEVEVALALISKQSSKWARNRAYQVAVEYSFM
ncbi:hypothetical protein ACHAXS_001538 [Conticribra weissflogii]